MPLLSEVASGEDRSLVLTALINSAVHDPKPSYDLPLLSRSIVAEGLQEELDALSIIHHVLPSAREGADELLVLIAQSCSPKETIIASQEIAERLTISSDAEEEQDADVEQASLTQQIARVMTLYATAIHRLRVSKTASDRLQNLLPDLETLVLSAATTASVQDCRLLVGQTSHLVQSTSIWAGEGVGDDHHELARCNTILTSLLDTTLESCVDKIGSSVDQRSFEAHFPRLVFRSQVRPDWEAGQKAAASAVAASNALGRTYNSLQSHPSIASLFLLAHSSPPNRPTLALLDAIFPIILTSLQSNTALESSLSILLEVFCAGPLDTAAVTPDILVPLATILPPLCSVHPDPPTRHLTFRLFGQILGLTPFPLRLQILEGLLSPSEDTFPQMRTAAVGLLKEAVIEALASTSGAMNSTAANPFASPLLLQTIGPHVFRPDPPDLFSSDLSLGEFQASTEPARLAECIGFYYVLLLRDADNRTGIRDNSSIRSIEHSLLGPLRSALDTWLRDDAQSHDLHDVLPLASLQTSIERIDGALKGIVT